MARIYYKMKSMSYKRYVNKKQNNNNMCHVYHCDQFVLFPFSLYSSTDPIIIDFLCLVRKLYTNRTVTLDYMGETAEMRLK